MSEQDNTAIKDAEAAVKNQDEESGSSSSNHVEVVSNETSSKHIVSFEENDPASPYNWSTGRKLYIELIATLLILNSTIDSSLPSGVKPQLQRHFNVASEEQLVLPTSVFLIGYILGPLIFAPMSERNGRQLVFVVTYAVFLVFTLALCFSPNWPSLLIFRLLTGIFASPALSVTGGLYADIYKDPGRRGASVAWFMMVASIGPASGPLCSGYLAKYSWRWPFWFQLIFAGASAIFIFTLPETFGPEILRRRAKKLRKENPSCNAWAPIELETTSTMQKIKAYAGRPLRMLITEPIVTFSCLFLSLIYAVWFMLFQGYAIIFQPIYGFSQGQVGLAFIPIIIGCTFSLPIYLFWQGKLRRAQNRGDAWTKKEENKRLPLSIIGGPFFTIGLFWIGWGAQRDVHWIVPMLGGLPLGCGFVLIFISLANYMADAYGIFAASALGAASIARSIFGVVLPFATEAMFGKLGVSWACSLLGFINLAMCLIPFFFLKFGTRIREKSRMCKELAQK